MAVRKPLVVGSDGRAQQLQAGDTIPTVSASITEVEVDFGASAVRSTSFIITDATVAPTSKILVSQSGNAATGRQADENEMDQLQLWARPNTGTFTLYGAGTEGPISGKFKINYLVG